MPTTKARSLVSTHFRFAGNKPLIGWVSFSHVSMRLTVRDSFHLSHGQRLGYIKVSILYFESLHVQYFGRIIALTDITKLTDRSSKRNRAMIDENESLLYITLDSEGKYLYST